MSVGESRRVSLSLPELGAYEDETPPSPTCWQRWKGRTVTLMAAGVTATSLAVLVSDLSSWTNAVGCLGVGAGVQQLVESMVSRNSLQMVRQWTMSTFGQSMVWWGEIFYENVEPLEREGVYAAAVTLGANLGMWANWFWENHFAVRIESQPLLSETEIPVTFEGIFVNQLPKDLLRGAAAVTATVGAALTEDQVSRALLGSIATYYSAQIAGDRIINYLDRKIESQDEIENKVELTQRKGSTHRKWKIGLNSAGFFVIPALLIPFYGDTQTAKRIEQLIFDGAWIGFFDAVMNQSFENRLKKVPLKQLHEVQFCDQGAPSVCCNRSAYRIWSVAFPVLNGVGLIIFIGGTWEYFTPIQRGALCTLLGGYSLATGLANLIDRLWDRDRRIAQGTFLRAYRKKRQKTREELGQATKIYALDKAYILFNLTQRFFGISPAIVFSFVTNAVAMNDKALEEESDRNKGIIMFGWFAYGFAWGLELVRTGGRRRGAQFRLVLLAVINGALTFKRLGQGDV